MCQDIPLLYLSYLPVFNLFCSFVLSSLAENIEFIVGVVDPKRRILKNVKASQFEEADFAAINNLTRKYGASALL